MILLKIIKKILKNEMIKTLTRIADFSGKFREILDRYSSEFLPMPGFVEKYGLYDDSKRVLIIVSNSQPQQNPEYNTILTITSRDSRKNLEIAQEVENKTGVRFRKAPERLEAMMQGICLAYSVFEVNGKSAMEFLAQISR